MTYYAGYIGGQCDSTRLCIVQDANHMPIKYQSVYLAMSAACQSCYTGNGSSPVVMTFDENANLFRISHFMVMAGFTDVLPDARLGDLIRDGIPVQFSFKATVPEWVKGK